MGIVYEAEQHGSRDFVKRVAHVPHCLHAQRQKRIGPGRGHDGIRTCAQAQAGRKQPASALSAATSLQSVIHAHPTAWEPLPHLCAEQVGWLHKGRERSSLQH